MKKKYLFSLLCITIILLTVFLFLRKKPDFTSNSVGPFTNSSLPGGSGNAIPDIQKEVSDQDGIICINESRQIYGYNNKEDYLLFMNSTFGTEPRIRETVVVNGVDFDIYENKNMYTNSVTIFLDDSSPFSAILGYTNISTEKDSLGGQEQSTEGIIVPAIRCVDEFKTYAKKIISNQ